MSTRNIDEIITAYGQGTGDLVATRNARAELAALRVKADESDKWHAWNLSNDEYIERIEKLIAEQARQLEEAYRIAARVADNCAINGDGNDRLYKVAMDISRQLLEIAANVPALQAQPTQRVTAEDERMWDE